MTNILIIDDNPAKAAFLKMSLVRSRHKVKQSRDIIEAVFPDHGKVPNLVLINQAMQNFTGWELYFYLKQIMPGLPVMVYVMESNCIEAAGWICKAVDAVCEETHAIPDSHPSTTDGTQPVGLGSFLNSLQNQPGSSRAAASSF